MKNPLIVALDAPTVEEAAAVSKQVGDAAGAFKVGLMLWAASGPDAVRSVDAPVFLDLKLHDIPHQVAGAVRALAAVAPAMLTVHTLGGRAMLEAAVEAVPEGTALLAVTILTSLHDHALAELGLPPASEAVPLLAQLAAECGCHGVVCSAADLVDVRQVVPADFLLVTPGVRMPGDAADDQARIATPHEAIASGATHIVVGRPITGAPDPRAAADAVLADIRP